jgi:hypothetical protein
MDLSNDDIEQRDAADRREVDPPVQVEAATWSRAGQLDWWVTEGRSGLVGYAVQTAGNDGSKLLIFDLRAAHGHGTPPGTWPTHEVRTPLTTPTRRRSTKRVRASIASSRGE